MNARTPIAAIACLLVAGAAGADEQLVIVNEEQPADAFAPTAGSEGFSDGYAARQAQDHFLALDRDGSGRLSPAEIPQHTQLGARFADYDLNADGDISRNEFQSWYAATSALDGVAATDHWDAIAEDRE
jgi:hypothetical protein